MREDETIALYGGTPVRERKIFYGKQFIDAADIEAVLAVLKSEYLTQGPQIKNLEDMLCRMFSARYAISTMNGTSALHLACIAAGITNGDEVITTPLTFAASANCVRYCGGTVVFADICKDSYTIDPLSVEKKITERTKAVIAVDYAGIPCRLQELKEICERHNLVLIEDAAHSFGSVYNGRPVGSIADITAFSFHPVKTITGGEGGAVLTNNKQYADVMRLVANHGITKDKVHYLYEDNAEETWYCEQILLGYNYRMTDMQAALIISQANKLAYFKQRRKEIVAAYNDAFLTLQGLIIPEEKEYADTCWHLYVLRIDELLLKCSRNEFFRALSAENIQPQVHYVPVHLHPYYRQLGHSDGECPIAEDICSSILSLPLYPSMTDADVSDVITAVRKIHKFYFGRR